MRVWVLTALLLASALVGPLALVAQPFSLMPKSPLLTFELNPHHVSAEDILVKAEEPGSGGGGGGVI